MQKTYILLSVLLAILLLLFGMWRLSRSRSFQFYGGLITHVKTDEPVVALTFDDGPNPEGTETTLAILDSLNTVATFFLTGNELERHMKYGRLIVESGHALGNHSYSHSQMVLRSPSFVRNEIVKTDSLIRVAGWHGEIPFRPPYAKRLFVLPRYLHQMKRNTYLWDIEPESYQEVAARAERIAAHVIDRVRPGSIILLHTMYPSREQSRQALPLIIEGLRKKGYEFVTLQQMLSHGEGAV